MILKIDGIVSAITVLFSYLQNSLSVNCAILADPYYVAAHLLKVMTMSAWPSRWRRGFRITTTTLCEYEKLWPS
jgi:hypothetical protein